MARPMRTPVKWDRGSVSVAPIAQPFKGILEDFGIPESAYSAEGGFGGSGLLDWEPAEFISPDVVWGTQYVSGAPPPSEYGDVGPNGDDNGKKCDYGKYANGSCKPKPDDGCDAGFHKEGGVCVKNDVDDPCKGVTCGENQRCVNGVCVDIEVDVCRPPNGCGVWPTCYPCDPGQDPEDEEDDPIITGPEIDYTGMDFDYEIETPEITGFSQDLIDNYIGPDRIVSPLVTTAGPAAVSYSGMLDDFTSVWPTTFGTPYEDEITSPFYDPWEFEDIRGGRR